MSALGTFGDRYAVVHDVRGPRIRLGVLWGVGLIVVFALGSGPVTLFFALNAAVAALQSSARWRDAGVVANQMLAAVGAEAIVCAAWINNTVCGVIVIVFVVATLVFPESFRLVTPTGVTAALATSWGTLAAGLFVGLAGAAAVQLGRIDSMALLFLITVVCVYDVGDYLCGEGPGHRWVGPLAGMLGVVVVTVVMAIVAPPPFNTRQTAVVGGLCVLLCPTGQVFGSWLLPRARTHAPGIRRLDGWLLTAPMMLGAAWIAQR